MYALLANTSVVSCVSSTVIISQAALRQAEHWQPEEQMRPPRPGASGYTYEQTKLKNHTPPTVGTISNGLQVNHTLAWCASHTTTGRTDCRRPDRRTYRAATYKYMQPMTVTDALALACSLGRAQPDAFQPSVQRPPRGIIARTRGGA